MSISREKSASREASQLLRRYMPAHLFPAPAAEQGQQQQQQQAEAQEQEQQKEQSGDGEQQQGKGTQGEAEAAGGRIVPGAKEDQEQGGGSRGGSGGAKGKRGGGGGDDGGDSGSEGDSDSDEEGGAEDAPNGTDTRRTGPSALGLVKVRGGRPGHGSCTWVINAICIRLCVTPGSDLGIFTLPCCSYPFARSPALSYGWLAVLLASGPVAPDHRSAAVAWC